MNGLGHYKLSVPPVSGQLPRPQQVALLCAQLQRTGLLWVIGLPGSGKTSLAAQALRDGISEQHTRLWYRLDEDDHDVAGFFGTLRASLPEIQRALLPVWSPENQPELLAFARQFFAQLTQQTPCTLVLDDCHRVADDSSFFTLLDAAREIGRERLTILAISRRPPPAVLTRGLAGGWLAIFDELAVSHEEAVAIAEHALGKRLTAKQATSLDLAQGWIAHALALARLADAGHAPNAGFGREGMSATLVGDYLAQELLAAASPGTRASLRHLAEPPEIPPALMIDDVISPELRRMLEHFASRSYFVEFTTSGGLRLHDLLRDALRGINAHEDSPAQLAAVRVALAQRLEAAHADTAIQLHATAQNVEGVLRVLAQRGNMWLEQGMHHKMLSWLYLITTANDNAMLSLWRAEALLPTQPETARPLFRAARAHCAELGQAGPAYRAWCGEVASYVVQWGAVQGLAELVDDLEALDAQFGGAPEEWAFRTQADALTALMYGRAEDPRMARYAEATSRAVEHAPNADARITAAAQLLIYKLWWSGDFPGGRALYDAFDKEVRDSESLAPLPRLIWWSCAAIVDWQCGKPEDCYDKVESGLALAAQSGIHVRDFFLLTQGIFCALAFEDWSRAERYLEQLARTERTQKRLDVMVHHFFRSWYHLCRGDAQRALTHAETALPLAESMGSTFHRIIVYAALAPARVHTSDIAGAETIYRAQLELAKLSRNPTFTYIAFCAGAEIALATNDEARLAVQIDRMLTVKQLGGFHSGCGWRTPLMAELFAFALTRHIKPELVRQWIRQRQVPRPLSYTGDAWPMPVEIRVLGGLSVLIDGESAEGSKAAARLKELLAVLVVERRGASQASLCDWLWSASDGDKAQAALKVSVHRLRQWLGADAVITRGGSVQLNPAHVDCELWRLFDARGAFIGIGTAPNPERVLLGYESPPVIGFRKRIAGVK